MLKKAYVTNSSDSKSLQLDQFKTAVVQLFRSDIPKRQSLSLRRQKQRNKELNFLRPEGLNLQKSEILPDICKKSIEIGLDSDNTNITTRAQSKLQQQFETIDGN